MATFTLLGVTHTIQPYKLGLLRKVSPILDRIKDRGDADPTAANAFETVADMAAVLSPGLMLTDPTLTVERLDEMIGVDDLPELRRAFFELTRESGMGSQSGEATASPTTTPAEAE